MERQSIQPHQVRTSGLHAAGILQRKCACGQHTAAGGECEECKDKRASGRLGAQPGPAPPIVHEVLRSAGQPLDQRTRGFLEPRFGQDFSRVRVHTDGRAAASARAVDALAYTAGEHVVFAAGQYSPRTPAGQRVLAHELTHVAQQRNLHGGPTLQTLRIGQENDIYERQAEAFADAVTAGGRPHGSPLAVQVPALQRLGAGDAFLRFFGIESGDFSPADLTEYLDRIAKNRQCDCGVFDFLSDDKAREVINHWGVGEYNLDQDYKGVPSVEIKRILIQELLAGPTGDADEKAITKVVKDSSADHVTRLLDPRHGLDVQQLLDNVNSGNQDELLHVLEQKLPDIGGAHLKRSEKPGEKSGDCTVARALKIHFAHQTAEFLVQRAIDMLDQFAANPVRNKNVEQLLDCYFKGANAAGQVSLIRQNFRLIKEVLPKLFYFCPAEPFKGYKVSAADGTRVFGPEAEAESELQPEGEVQARALVEKEQPAKPRPAGKEKTPAPQAPASDAGKLSVLLFPGIFDAEPDELARNVIHEALHHALKQGDEVKEIYQLKCGEPAGNIALTNAQSYAMFAAHLAQEGLHLAFIDCPDAWKNAMITATRTAETWVRDAIAKLDAALADPKSADSRTRSNLKRHFKTDPSEPKVVKEIRDTLAEIQAAFGGEIPFECETGGEEDKPAEVGGLLGIFPRGGNLHLFPAWFVQKPSKRAEIILHEMAHRYAGKWGFNELYMDRDSHQYSAQSTSSALGNADSFAQFARMLQEPAADTAPPEPEKEKGKP